MAVNIGPRIGIDGEAEYHKSIKNIIQDQKTLKAEMKATASEWDKNTTAEKKAADQKSNLTKQIKSQEEEVKKLSEMVKQSTEKYGENDTKTLKWKETLNKATAELNNMKTELRNIPSDVEILGKKFEESGEKIKDAGEKIESAGKKLAPFSAAAAGGLTYSVKTASDFEAQMSKVQAISGASADTMDVLERSARDWGKSTKFSAVEAGEAFEYMAMAGWKDEQMLAGIGPVLNLAAASGEELGTTSDIVTDALTAFGLQAEDAGRFANVLAAASSNANTNVSMLGESFTYAAPVAGALGYDVEDVAIALGLMANAGIKGSQAGTSLRNVFQRMAKPTKESADAMERLGLSLYDEEGNMYSFMEVMEQLRESMEGINMPTEEYLELSDQMNEALENGSITQKQYNDIMGEAALEAFGAEGAEKARAAAMLGGARAMAGLLAIANASEEDFNKLSSAVSNSSNEFAMLADGSIVPLTDALASGEEVIATFNGSAEAMAAVMQDNLQGQLTELKSATDELAISIGESLAPTIKTIVDKLQEFVNTLNSLDPETKEMIATVGVVVAALAPVLIVVGQLVTSIGAIVKVVGAAIPAIAAINPVVALVVAAIGALIAIGVVLYQNWDTIKQKASEFAQRVSANWKELCDYLKGRIDTTIQGILAAKDALVRGWEDLKAKISTIKDNIVKTWDDMKAKITTTVENIKTKVQTTFENIRDKIKESIEKARDTVKEAIEKIKEFLHFDFKLPDLKLPHIEYDLISVPVLGTIPDPRTLHVEWYAKAMENGMILNNPTIFGAANGHFLGGGEAGPEVVVGASSLYRMIQGAVGNTYNNGGNNVYVYGAPGQDVHELAREIANIINADVQAEGAVW